MDQTTLAMSGRQGIEIDYCPTCRGVWLDRGELDKLIAAQESTALPQARPPEDAARRDDHRAPAGGSHYHKNRKKESLLADLFDF